MAIQEHRGGERAGDEIGTSIGVGQAVFLNKERAKCTLASREKEGKGEKNFIKRVTLPINAVVNEVLIAEQRAGKAPFPSVPLIPSRSGIHAGCNLCDAKIRSSPIFSSSSFP